MTMLEREAAAAATDWLDHFGNGDRYQRADWQRCYKEALEILIAEAREKRQA